MDDDGLTLADDLPADTSAARLIAPAPRRTIGADEIYARIPHDGPMRLLDAVLSWDEKTIHCSATSHADRANPLGDEGILHNVHALEYAAQAIAVHGSLLLSDDPSSAEAALKLVYVGTFRNVEMRSTTVDADNDSPLQIRAELYAAVRGAWSYGFTVATRGATIVRGQATVVVPGAPA